MNRSGMAGLIFLGCILGCIASGCGTERLAPCSETQGGIIEGRILTGRAESNLRVRATEVHRVQGRQTFFEADADSRGYYRMALPAGAYRLEAGPIPYLGSSTGPWCGYRREAPPSYSLCDTLQLAQGDRLTADFALGSMEVAVNPPQGLEGDIYLELFSDSCTSPSRCDRALYTSGGHINSSRQGLSLTGLVPGSYRMEVTLVAGPSGRGESFWLPGARGREDAAALIVPAGGTLTREFMLPDRPAIVAGSITGSWQRLTTDRPLITLLGADSLVIGQLVTDADGAFEYRIYLPEPAKALIEIHGSRRWYGGSSFEDAAVIPLAAGQTAPRIEVLESGLMVDVHDPSYEEYSDGLIQILDPQGIHVIRELETRTQYAGTIYPMCNLDPGAYLLRVLPRRFLTQGWIGQWYDGAGTSSEATPIIIPENGGIARVRVDLEEGGQISGMLRFTGSLVFLDAVFYLTRADDPGLVGSLGPEGTHVVGTRPYTLSGIPAGRYKLGVLPLGPGEPWPQQPPPNVIWYPGTTSWDEATALDLVPPAAMPGIDFELGPPGTR